MSGRESNDQQRASQTVFLSGPTLYLRLVEPEDARTAMIWRETPFPAPTGVVEDDLRTLLEQDPDILEANLLLLMCRREDDVPVGSVRVLFDDWRFGHVTFTPDRLAPVGMQSDAVAETLGILLPFLLFERNMMVVGFELRDDWAAAMAHVIERGGREQFRQRERYLVDGRRVDARYFQVFNPVWVEKLGPSPPPIFGSAEQPARVPIIRPVVSEADGRPPEAMVVGERLYLRPIRVDDGHLIARWSREESEIFYPEGRVLIHAHTFGAFHRRLAMVEYPSWIRFAIALRKTDELIGCTGLDHISWVHRTAETETEIFRPEHRSAGFGTEAKQLLLAYGFDRIGLHMVYSFVAEGNQRSAQALRKQGYRDAGRLAWESFCKTGVCDYLAFDLLAEEWRAARDGSGD